ncbi:MAG: hypothetical protein BMS9Abin34_508 [Patescibacteria group bacterium]|nr:MAG: hypothetical protein BMS9Abin34_508 [Patescibacteria group bacterium]
MLPDLLFQLGAFRIYTLGAFLAGAYLLSAFIFWRLGRREGFSSDDLFDLVFSTSLIALVGGRVVFLAVFGGLNSLGALVRVGEGISWVGALLFGAIAFYLFVRVKKWSFFRVGDLAVLALAFGQAVGFLGAELVDYIPYAFYLVLGYLALGGFLQLLRRRFSLGVPFFSYLVLSGVFVYFSEWLRPDRAVWAGVNINFASGVFLVVLGVAGVAVLSIAKRPSFRVKRKDNGKS